MKKIFLTEGQIGKLQTLMYGSRDNLLLPYLNYANSKINECDIITQTINEIINVTTTIPGTIF